MKKSIYALFLAFCMLFLAVPVHAATVDKNNFHFSDMHLKRVWFQNMDPIFKVDHYEPVELAEGLNITGIGNLSNVTAGEASDGFLAPMKEFFHQIGGSYKENGDTVTMSLNGDTLVMTVGSTDVKLNGENLDSLPEASTPRSINIAEHPVFGPANPLVASDVEVMYLPVRYILEAFQAAIYWDGGQSSIYAVVKVLKNESDTIPNPDKQGSRLDQVLQLDVNENKETGQKIANNIVDLQNSDGGFMNLAGDVNMAQDQLVNKIGIKRNSSIEEIANGQVSTVTELRFLANMIEAYPDEAELYKPAFEKGIQYLLDAQLDNGCWALQKDGIGYYSSIAYADNAKISVLTLFNDIARLNHQDFTFLRKNNQELVLSIDEALEKGINCLVNSQITVNDDLTGWSSHHHPIDLVPVIGKTHEREGINAAETTRIADFLMNVRTPSEEVKTAIESAVAWLEDVEINDKKMKTVTDITMNNGIERFLVDEAGHVTWARNYKVSGTGFEPFFSDRQFDRGDIPLMNFDPNDPRDVIGTPAANKYYSNYNVATDAAPKIMFYETRTEYEWYVETPRKLIETDYPQWKKYLENGWPELPVDPEEPQNGDTIVVKPVLSDDIGEASVAKSTLNDAFAQTPKVKGVKMVKVLLEKVSGTNSYELKLPTEFLTKGGKNQRIQLSTEFGKLTLEGHMLSNAKVKDADTVTVSISAGTSDENKPSIELGVKANGKQVNYDHPGAPVHVVIPYEPTSDELENPERIGVAHIDEKGNRTAVKTGKYEADKGGVTLKTTHFGWFEVVYK